jgi:uncharacterized protein YciI
MGRFVSGFLFRDSSGVNRSSEPQEQLQAQHVAHMFDLLRSGKVVAVGPFLDSTDLRGVIVFSTDSVELAREWFEADPLLKEGYLRIFYLRWFAAKGIMKSVDSTGAFNIYQFGILKKGPSWSPLVNDSTKALQESHMTNIRRMADMKKLVIAGPFIDGGDWRGIFVFTNTSAGEARAIAANDPAIQVGRLTLDLHPWMVPAGCLP